MYTSEEAGDAVLEGAAVLTPPDERWRAVFHTTLGWLHAPPGSHFQRTGETIELVGAIHRSGRAWYASSISKLEEDS